MTKVLQQLVFSCDIYLSSLTGLVLEVLKGASYMTCRWLIHLLPHFDGVELEKVDGWTISLVVICLLSGEFI